MATARYLASISHFFGRVFGRAIAPGEPDRDSHQQKKLVESELEAVFRAMDIVSVLIDGRDNILWCSSRAVDVFRIGATCPENRPASDVFRRYPEIHAYLQQSQFDEPLLLRAAGQSEPALQLRVIPYGIDRKLMMQQEGPLIRQLQTIRQDFVVNVSHEMRTPLTVLFGYLEAMTDSSEWSDSDWKPIIDTMYAQTYRMQHIVEKLLQLARIENADDCDDRPEMVDVKRLLAPIIIEAKHFSGKSAHVIEVEYSGQTRFYGFAADLGAIMSNLIINAVKYTPPGGHISVKWSLHRQEAIFEVADTGIGVCAKHIPRLTERFYRVDTGRSREFGGTGLGLAIVKHAVRRAGGRLEIESKLTEGSLFRCHLPVKASVTQP